MIKFKEIKKTYKRIFQDEGKNLVFIKLTLENDTRLTKYHYIFDNGVKPPLDIAINIDDGIINYLTYFIMAEKIEIISERLQTIKRDCGIKIDDDRFTEWDLYIYDYAEFDILYCENYLYILKRNYHGKIYEYDLDDNNSLFLKQGEFLGLVLKNITLEELNTIKSTNVF